MGRLARRVSILQKITAEADLIRETSSAYIAWEGTQLQNRLVQLAEVFRCERETSETLMESLAILTEVSDRLLGLRPHVVQIMGVLGLHRGYLIEMATGEGKSLTACLAGVLTGWQGHPCHILTVNDYLAARDEIQFMSFYDFCGISVGVATDDMDDNQRREVYRCGVVYTTAKQLLADFVRDRLKLG